MSCSGERRRCWVIGPGGGGFSGSVHRNCASRDSRWCAITSTCQQAALSATDTVLLESGPGHATRCLSSPFTEQFEAEKRRLDEAGTSSEETRMRLEQLNIGRLRIAAKGVDRNEHYGQD